MFRHRLLIVIIAGITLLTACGEEADSPSAGPAAIAPLPVPSEDVVLTITGVDKPNVGDQVRVDLDGIESLGTTTVTLQEPFLNEELEVTGVAIDDLLAAAGVDLDATLVWTALDDYQVHFSRREIGAENALLATRINDMPIDVVDGGPIRIIFTEPGGELGRDTNQWIWSLYQIEVG